MNLVTDESILRIVLGCALLLAGRNIFWLFIMLAGFLIGAELAEIWFKGQPMWVIISVAITVGIIGVVLSVIYQRVAFALGGFYAAGYLAIVLSAKLGIDPAPVSAVLITGLFGSIIAWLLMDWTIIILSSLAGAAVIVNAIVAPPATEAALFLALVITGVMVQWSVFKRREVL